MFVAVTSAAIATSSAWATEENSTVPDFSGPWGREFIGFEQPVSGHGPIANISRLPTGQANFNLPAGNYADPILKPGAAAISKKRGEISLSGDNFPQPTNQCWPQPTPYIFWQQKIEFLQRKDELVILYQFDHQVRHVKLNAQHPTHVVPSWSGDSVGHYEGHTLIIDTVGVKVGPFSMVDWLGTPQSEAVHVVERYRLIDYQAALAAEKMAEKENVHLTPERPISDGVGVDIDYRGKGLQLEFTVEDPNIVTMPWSAVSTYRKAATQWEERVCAENPRVYYAPHDTAVPFAAKPDF
jgi:hypothetical protein